MYLGSNRKFSYNLSNSSKAKWILETVSSFPKIAAISNTGGPNFSPTNINRKGSCNSPGFIFACSASCLNKFSEETAVQSLILVNDFEKFLKSLIYQYSILL